MFALCLTRFGTVTLVSLARNNREFLLGLQARSALLENLHNTQAHLYLARQALKKKAAKAEGGKHGSADLHERSSVGAEGVTRVDREVDRVKKALLHFYSTRVRSFTKSLRI